jgi:hypothetical protein
MEKVKPVTENIERNILLQLLGVSLLVILLYIFNSLFVIKSEAILKQSLVVFAVYGVLFIIVYLPGNFQIKKQLSSVLLYLSIGSSFFSLGGMKGLACIDIVNIVLYTSVMYKGRERNFYFIVLFTMLFSLAFVQINFPSIIKNESSVDPDWMLAINILIRIGLSLNIGLALRQAYSKEHDKANDLIVEINNLNNEILAQNEELRSIQEDLKSNNTKLERIVYERTKKLEEQNDMLTTYAYMNSHIFRGPVCRLLGLLQLMKLEKKEESKVELESYLYEEVESIDRVVKDISKMLYESDEELMDEIRLKAKKLYRL